MKIRRLWVILALLVGIVFASARFMPETMAYIAAESNTLRNTFRVEYLPPADIAVPVQVHKTVHSANGESVSPAGFSFVLSRVGGADVIFSSDADGDAAAWLHFTAEDAGKTYAYHLFEVNDGREHIVYSDAVHDICITLTLDAQNQIIPVMTLDGAEVSRLQAEFVNVYAPFVVPDTGDHTHLLLHTGMLLFSAAGLLLIALRRSMWIRRQSVY